MFSAPAATPAHHHKPFAAKSVYFEERWAEKQAHGFTKWLNFVFTTDCGLDLDVEAEDASFALDTSNVTVHLQEAPVDTVLQAPCREVLSLRAYSDWRALNRLRRDACRLFSTELVAEGVRRLEAAVEAGRSLRVRADVSLRADRGARQSLLRLLMGYNPLWLRLAAETVLGEVAPLASLADRQGLASFVSRRLLWSEHLARRFAHPGVVRLYKPGFDECLSKFIMKKTLTLVFFLDRAKRERLIQLNPCLFLRSAAYKCSRDVLLQLARDLLSGVGDLCRVMNTMGCGVSVEQTPLEEFQLRVRDLADDLRDGVRLCKLAEILTRAPLRQPVRCPAISRLQKVHNVEVALRALNQHQDLEAVARAVVDGHREKTLALLWSLVSRHGGVALLDQAQLDTEVRRLHEELRAADLPPPETLTADSGACQEQLLPLLNWCRAVCARYSLEVHNFTVSFSDGRVLALLVSHYQPALLRRSEIRWHTLAAATEENMLCSERPANTRQLLANEAENVRLVAKRVTELGGVPPLLRVEDVSNTIPDEKVVATYVSCLCVRLLELHQETRAVLVIQRVWREVLRRRRLPLLEKSARVIQAWYRKVRGHRSRKLPEEEAAVVLQRIYRLKLLRRQNGARERAAVILQRIYRLKLSSRIKAAREKAAIVLQRIYRLKLLRRQNGVRERAAVVLQRIYRQKLLRRRQNALERAALVLQRIWRRRAMRRLPRQENFVYSVRKSLLEPQVTCFLPSSYHKVCKSDGPATDSGTAAFGSGNLALEVVLHQLG